MKKTHKAKAVAGTGVLSVLLGALMVFAPAASSAENPTVQTYDGNPACTSAGYGYGFDLKDNNVDTSGAEKTISDSEIEVTYSTRTVNVDGTDTLFIDWSSVAVADGFDGLLTAVLVKQGNGGASFTYDPATNSGTVYVIPNGNASANGISHLSFCHNGASESTTTSSEATTTTEADKTTTEAEATTTTEAEATTTTEAEVTTTTEAEATTTTEAEVTTTTEGEVLGTTTIVDETTTTEGETTTTEGEVIGDEVTSTTAGPTVLDNTVNRGTNLARTGSATDRLGPIGAALMILGAILVGGSRRSLISND